MATTTNTLALHPTSDPAAPVLENDTALDDQSRADLWDVFHNSKSGEELASKLQPLTAVSDDTKARLYDAKRLATPAVDPVEQTLSTIRRLAQIEPAVADFAEKHPNLLKTFLAASTPSKSRSARATKSKTATVTEMPSLDKA